MDTRTRYIALAVAALLAVAAILFFLLSPEELSVTPAPEPEAPTTEEPAAPSVAREVIGTSVEGRDIEAYTYGTGDTALLFVGGVHGGYEWNSVLLAYEFMDYIAANPDMVPDNLAVTIIPSLNPDGVYDVIGKEGRFTLADAPGATTGGAGRFNANDVDLNRNFDCKWQPTSTWRGNTVSAGTSAFSEPEAAALRDFVLANRPDAVVFWHSQANAVYASECEDGILPETRALMSTYAAAAGYPSVDVFDAYPVTGDAEGWLASIGIPAITVELSSHTTLEWAKNLAGFEAVVASYGEAGSYAR